MEASGLAPGALAGKTRPRPGCMKVGSSAAHANGCVRTKRPPRQHCRGEGERDHCSRGWRSCASSTCGMCSMRRWTRPSPDCRHWQPPCPSRATQRGVQIAPEALNSTGASSVAHRMPPARAVPCLPSAPQLLPGCAPRTNIAIMHSLHAGSDRCCATCTRRASGCCACTWSRLGAARPMPWRTSAACRTCAFATRTRCAMPPTSWRTCTASSAACRRATALSAPWTVCS